MAVGLPLACYFDPSVPVQARLVVLALFSVLFSAHMFLFHGQIRQPLEYHKFADNRALLGCCGSGIPNTFDVLSNIPFFLAGAHGLALLQSPKVLRTLSLLDYYGWLVFALGVMLVSVGSAYYHWRPNNKRLVWDRLPMTVGFMSLFAVILDERAFAAAGFPVSPVVSAWILVGLGELPLRSFLLYVSLLQVSAAPVCGAAALALSPFPAHLLA